MTDPANESGSTILVAGVLKDYEEALEALVSNSRRGGGIVADYVYDDEHELAWITFENPSVAENFLKVGVLRIQGHEMRVLSPPDKKTLYIRGIPPELNELVEIFLESPRKGGGPIFKYDYNVGLETVTVSFADEQVAQRLLDMKFMMIKDKELFFSKIPCEALLPPQMEEGDTGKAPDTDILSEDNSSKPDDNTDTADAGLGSFADDKDNEEDDGTDVPESDLISRSICIKDVPHEMVDFLEIVLSQEKSGGGNIEELVQDGSDVRVTFEDPSVAQRFLDSGKVIFGKNEFTVLPPPERFPRTFSEAFEEEKECEVEQLPSAKVHVRGIPPSVDEQILLMILEREEVGGGTVVDVKFVPGSGEAIIQFEDYQIAQNLLTAGRFHFKKTTLEILPVAEGEAEFDNATIEIRNIPKSMDKNKLYLFFENKKRSGGGAIAELNFDEVKGTAVVTFSDPEVATSLLEKKVVKYNDGTMMEVCRPTSSSPPPPGDDISHEAGIVGKVWVSEIPGGTKRQTLIMFFENKRRSGGGEVVESEFDYDEEAGTALVTFKDSSVAEAMIEKGELSFGKNVLKVKKPSAELSVATNVAKTAHSKTEPQQNESCTVELRGCMKDLTRDSLLLWFENKNRSGGGYVEDIQFLSNELAIITFKNAEDAARVAAKGKHALLKANLSACLMDCWPDVGGPHAIRVKGFKSGTSREMIEMYFESEKRSGGGVYEEFLFDESQQMAVLTFSDPNVVRRIMKKIHVLEGSTLSVETLDPGRPPPLLRPADVDPDKLLFTDLDSSKISTKNLKEFAERAGKAKVRKVTFSSRPGIALVQFFEKPDYHHAKAIVCSRPCQGKMISMEQVPVSKCIQVHSIDKLSQDALELYFESKKKSGGGPLKTLKFVEGDYSIIEFNDREDFERVLSNKHSFNQQNLDVQLYCPCLGVFPPGFDGSSPVPPIPPDFKVDCPKEVLKFFQTHHEKKRIEHHMNRRKCFLTWPRSGKTLINLHCTIQPNDPNAFQMTQKWSDECRSFLQAEIEKVKFGEIAILNEIWKSFRDGVKERINAANDQLLFHEFDDQNNVLFFSGYANEVQGFAKLANSIKGRLEEELNRKKTEIKEHVQVRPHVIYLSKVTGFFLQFGDDIRVEETSKGFNLTGQPKSVLFVRLKLLEFANGLADKEIGFKPTSDAFEKVLNKAPVRDYVLECFSSHKVTATYEVKRGQIKLFGTNQEQLGRAEQLLMSEIVEKSFELDGAMKEVLQQKEWTNYKATLARDFLFLELSELKSSVIYVSKESDMQAISQRIRDFFSGNALYEQFIELPAGKLDVLTKHCGHLLEQLKEAVKPADLRICGLSGSEKSGISVRAKKPLIKQAECKVQELVAKVQSKDYSVDKQNAIKFLKSEKGQYMLHGISSKHRVVIKSADEEQNGGREKMIYSDPVLYATARLNQRPGKAVKLILGDITKNKTDTIVNAANSRLDHGGGVAGVIAKAASAKLTEECEKHIKMNGELCPGKVFVSVAGGSLPHKSVIHTVGPVWKDGKSGEEHELALAVTAALREAERRACKSVSLPFLSCGIFRFPKKKAASIIVKEVKEFLANSNSVDEVHIVNGSPDSLNIFMSAMSDFSAFFSLIPSLMASSSVSANTNAKTKKSQTRPKPQPQRVSSSSNRTKVGGADSFLTPEGLSVALIRGSIANAKVDAIFNSTEKNMNLSRTAVSKSLLLAAGSGLQTDCQTLFPQGIGYGNVVKTGAHKIPCKAIYHGACMRWDNGAGNSEQIIRKLVSGALQMAIRDGMTSLAFPAVGTGLKLRTPSRVVANAMIDEVIKFSARVQKSSLKEVQFVIYERDQDALDAFGAAMQSSSINAQSASGDDNNDDYVTASSEDEHDANSDDKSCEDDDDEEEEEEEQEQESKDDDADDTRLQPDSDDDESFEESGARRGGQYHGDHRKHGGSHGSSFSSTASVTVLDSTIGGVKFLVNCEDITRASVDAIVNGTNEKFDLKYGILSRTILKAAGSQIQEECLQNRKPDGWSVTSGGRLSSKVIFHIPAGGAKGWKSLIGKVLREADKRKLSSIAIPPVGVGRGSLTVKEFAGAIFEAVDDFSQEQPQHLQNICVSILDHKLLEEFSSEVKKIMNLQGKPFRQILSKVSDAFKSVFCDDDATPKRRTKSQTKQSKVMKRGKASLPKLILRVYGMDLGAIDAAIADIKQLCDEIKQEMVLESSTVREAISELTQEQENKIKLLEKQCSVKIRINRQRGRESIHLYSEDGDLTTAVTEIYSILIGFVTKERNSRELELFAKQAVWQYHEGGTWKKYGKYATGTIEKAHHKREKEVEYTDSKGIRHKINFKDKTDERSSGGKVQVARAVPGSISLPSRWKHMNPEENCLVVKLDPSGEEYKKVEANLKKTDAGSVQSIIQIDRIQNQSLYRQFMNRKLDMDRSNNLQGQAQAQENERRLWHGTSGTNVNNINNRNFNRSYCGAHGVAIGNGVYFATSAAYSIRGYCPVDASGHKHIYQARVLTGKFCQGRNGLKEAPLLQGSNDVTYDSVVDNPASPGMFVVFLDYQTYPEYHITFT